jgi:hypothetical protein
VALSGLLLLVVTWLVLVQLREESWLPALFIILGAFLLGDGVGRILRPRGDADIRDR